MGAGARGGGGGKRGAGLVIAEDLAALSAGGLESGYSEPCVVLVMKDNDDTVSSGRSGGSCCSSVWASSLG